MVALNGISSQTVTDGTLAKKLGEQLRSKDILEVRVKRPHLFSCTIYKEGMSMGLELNYSNYGDSLIVTYVASGAVRKHAPQVREGDRIIGVDNVVGNPGLLLQTIHDARDVLVLKMSRPSDDWGDHP